MQKLALTTYTGCIQAELEVTLEMLHFPSVPAAATHSSHLQPKPNLSEHRMISQQSCWTLWMWDGCFWRGYRMFFVAIHFKSTKFFTRGKQLYATGMH